MIMARTNNSTGPNERERVCVCHSVCEEFIKHYIQSIGLSIQMAVESENVELRTNEQQFPLDIEESTLLLENKISLLITLNYQLESCGSSGSSTDNGNDVQHDCVRV